MWPVGPAAARGRPPEGKREGRASGVEAAVDVVGFMGTNARALGCTTRVDMGFGKSKNEAGCGWMDMEMCGGCLCVYVLL